MTSSPTDSSTLAALHPAQSLEFHIRAIKTSLRLQGSYNLALRRPSKSPESSRSYVAGDPVNMIDWKAYARNDQILVRERRDEASASVRICLDISDTMQWPTASIKPATLAGLPTKMEVAIRIAFHLAHIHLRLGDAVDLWLLIDGMQKEPDLRLHPRSASEVLGLYEFLQGSEFSLAVLTPRFQSSELGRNRADICYWVGDGLGNGDYGTFLDLGRRRHLIHTLSSLETDISWVRGDICYFDEALGGKEYLGQVLSQNENYLVGLREWMGRLSKRLNEGSGGYLLATDKTSIAGYLEFLKLTATR